MKKYSASRLLLTFTLMILIKAVTWAQSDADQFKIVVGYKGDEIVLKCESGCAWTDLSFTLNQSTGPVYINAFGMASADAKSKKVKDLANFLFSVERLEDKIRCVSKKGTHWYELDFACPESICHAILTKSGVEVNY